MTNQREWDYNPQPDGEWDGVGPVGWHDRAESEESNDALLAEFQAYFDDVYPDHGFVLAMSPIFVRDATEVECRINGWEEGTFVPCTTRAKNPQPMWEIKVASDD